jgi:hypothetical protein
MSKRILLVFKLICDKRVWNLLKRERLQNLHYTITNASWNVNHQNEW